MSKSVSVSPVERDSPDNRGDDEAARDSDKEGSGDAWDNMMRPFDQDEEEEKERGEK